RSQGARVGRWLVLALVVLVSACGGGGSSGTPTPTARVSGTVAVGAPLSGAITAVGANGAMANTVSGGGGVYTLDAMGLTFPILLSATDGAGTVLYSWADAEGDIANITPLTTLALLLSNLADNLGGVFANWAPSSAQLDEAGMLVAQAIVNANLQSLFTDAGVDYTDYDFLTTPFSADGTGIDGLLDALQVNFDFLGGDLNSVVTITLAEDGTPCASGVLRGRATGSAAANLGGLMAHRGERGRRWTIHQGAAVGRPSRLLVDLDEQGGVHVGGVVRQLGSGTLRW
ncbi:PhzF family phenazine biosynthesis protein, partial [bacterium]|nr:PhzF family phenazine biosynthesis protein [bacterium]